MSKTEGPRGGELKETRQVASPLGPWVWQDSEPQAGRHTDGRFLLSWVQSSGLRRSDPAELPHARHRRDEGNAQKPLSGDP